MAKKYSKARKTFIPATALGQESHRQRTDSIASNRLSEKLNAMALNYARADKELDSIEDSWYEYSVQRDALGDYVGEALHHGSITIEARCMFCSALCYEEVEWFDSRAEADAFAFERAWLAHGCCETYRTGIRYNRNRGKWFAFLHEYEGVLRNGRNFEEE